MFSRLIIFFYRYQQLKLKCKHTNEQTTAVTCSLTDGSISAFSQSGSKQLLLCFAFRKPQMMCECHANSKVFISSLKGLQMMVYRFWCMGLCKLGDNNSSFKQIYCVFFLFCFVLCTFYPSWFGFLIMYGKYWWKLYKKKIQ